MIFVSVNWLEAQSEPAPDGTAYAGWLSILHGDPPPDSNETGHELVFLTDNLGTPIVDLAADAEALIDYAGLYVEVFGQSAEIAAQAVNPLSIEVESIREVAPPPGTELGVTASLIGSQPFINILCRFPDQTGNLYPASYYSPLFADTYPGINHYWQTMSYGNVDLDGTTTFDNWFTLPFASGYYGATSEGRALLAQHCADAAEGYLNFLPYVGINLMFNSTIGCCAYGGNLTLTLEGQTRNYRVTWMPPWAQVHSTLAHETGHALGLPHSSGPASNPPSELDIYVSHWDVMSASWGSCFDRDPVYANCLSPGTIAYHLDKSGWIPAARKTSIMPGNSATVTIEELRSLPGSNYVLARVPIGGSSIHFYTVEVRAHTGYDNNIPRLDIASPALDDPYVIIHKVNTNGHSISNAGDALIVDVDAGGPSDGDVNDDGAVWTTGETFADSLNNINITVNSRSGSGYSVTVTNNSTPLANPEAPSDLVVSAATGTSITINWQDNSFNEEGFRILHYIGNNTWVPLDTVGPNITTYQQTGLSCGAVKFYHVAAYKGAFEARTATWVRGDTTPCVPSLTAPTSGTSVSTPPVLQWSLNGGWTSFEVSLDTTTPPVSLISNVMPVAVENGVYRYALPATLPEGTYYWRVRAVNSRGIASAWSSIRSFNLVSAGNAAPKRNYYSTATPTLRWNPVTWAVGYEVQVNIAPDFVVPHAYGKVTSANQYAVTISPPLPDGVYYLRICAQDAAGNCAWSPTEAFVIDAP